MNGIPMDKAFIMGLLCGIILYAFIDMFSIYRKKKKRNEEDLRSQIRNNREEYLNLENAHNHLVERVEDLENMQKKRQTPYDPSDPLNCRNVRG